MSKNCNIEMIDRVLSILTIPFSKIDFLKKDMFNESNVNEVLEKVYPILNRENSIKNLDEIDLSFEMYYPKNKFQKIKESPEEYYMEILDGLSSTFISHRDGELVFKYWKNSLDNNSNRTQKSFYSYSGIEKILLWSSLNRIIPTDILGVNYLLVNNYKNGEYLDGYYSKIKLEDIQLDTVLQKGISETHLHLTSSTDFYNSWKNIMDINHKWDKLEIFDKVIGKTLEIKKNRKLAILLRIELAKFLISRESEEDKFLSYIVLDNDEVQKKEWVNYTEILDNNCDSLKKYLKNEFDKILYYEKEKDDYDKKDILTYLFKSEEMNTYTENIFLYESLKYLKHTKKNSIDKEYAKYFFMYIKIKSEFFKLMVQGNGIKGLDNFKSYFDRFNSVGENEDTNSWWNEKLKSQLRDKNLKKLEIRISFSNDLKNRKNIIEKKTKETLIRILSAYKDVLEQDKTKVVQLGIIYHFIKTKDINKKCWIRKEEEKNSKIYLAYENERLLYKAQGEVIKKLREEVTGLSNYIVGIDAANIENHAEPWVFSPIYEEMRNSDNGFMCKSNKAIKSLGFTFHAGEDFRHILTGLRRIDECLYNFKYHSGDRIGHGIALGLDVEKWYSANKMVILPRIEHLENIIWLWGKYKNTSNSIDMGFLERKAFELAKEIYINIEGITMFSLWEAYRNKFQEYPLEITRSESYKKCDYENDHYDYNYDKILCDSPEKIWTIKSLIKSYHCEKYLLRMREPIKIKIYEEDIKIFTNIQKILRDKLSKKGVIIETNPTSNSVIGNCGDIFEHYILTLNEIENVSDSAQNLLMVSINSDNPSVFNTSLSNEFAYIYYSLINEGHSKELVLKWIDKVREYGMASSFIRNRNVGNVELREELSNIIEQLNKK